MQLIKMKLIETESFLTFLARLAHNEGITENSKYIQIL